MSDCPDCENKVNEEKVEAAEEKVEKTEGCSCGCEENKEECSCGCEDAAENADDVKPPQPMAKKILWSVVRVVGLTVVVAVILFFVAKPQIMRWWYTDRENAEVKAQIETMLKAGLNNSGATYTIEYFDEGEPNPNGYRIVVTGKDGKEMDKFDMYAEYDEVKGELKLCFADGNPKTGKGVAWESIKGRLKRARKADAAPAEDAEDAKDAADAKAPAEIKAADAKDAKPAK